MSGDDHEDTNAHGPDPSIIGIRLRACEACKARKVRCDKLDPCSACRSSNIPCWTARPTGQQKRQRASVTSKYEEQLDKINEQLSQLQLSIDKLGTQNTQVSSPAVNRALESVRDHVGTPKSASSGQSPSSTRGALPYLGESSFEVHSQQAGQILDNALQNSPSAVLQQNVSSSLRLLSDRARSDNSTNNNFVTDLSLPPMPLALAALRLIDLLPLGFGLCSPFMTAERFKSLCQKVYFPADGYSMSDFVIVNGGLMGILGSATDFQRKACSIDPTEAAEAFTLCCNNVTATMDRLSPLLEPTTANIEAVLFGVQVAMSDSNHHLAWTLISFSARLCLDSGLNRLRDNPEDPELNIKKVCFWFTYAFDKGLSLNFGRTPTLSDYDITVGYPSFPPGTISLMAPLWFDLAKAQGRIYKKLYSAQGQLATPETRARNARQLEMEVRALRTKLRTLLDSLPELEREPFLDTEVTIIANLTLVYRALPTQKPAHPLRFSDECIEIAREALNLHETICTRFLDKMDNSIKMYIDWNLSICPFTPFIAVLGTAILDSNPEDMQLLEKVVASLSKASVHAPGAKKLYSICKILLRGAKSCVEQNASQNLTQPATTRTQFMPVGAHSNFQGPVPSNVIMAEHPDQFWSNSLPDDWSSLQLDNTDNMSFLFDNYLAGNPSVLPMFEPDLTRFDGM